MRDPRALKELDRLGQAERLEALSSRFKIPFIPEYEVEFFRRLYHPELMKAYEAADKDLSRKATSPAYAARGRVRRLLGDLSGAAQDLKAALDLEPDNAPALAWLGELDLARPEAEATLSRAIALDGRLWSAYLYRGASKLSRGEAAGAKADFLQLLKLNGRSALGWLLLGLCEEKVGVKKRAARAYSRAAKLHPVCSAAFLLWSRAETDPRRSALACEGALEADPTYALITLSRYKPGASWQGFLKWLRGFAFAEPERAGWYYRQEDIHYSPYQFQEYEDSSRLLALRPKAPWAGGLVGRGVLRCPPDPVRARLGLRVLRQACARAPRSGWVRAWRALGEIKDKQPKKALKDFAASIRLQPYYHRAYAWRGALLRGLGRTDEALRDLERAIAVDEQYAFAIHERSLARRLAGDFVGAALDLDRAFRQDFRYSWIFTVGREPRPDEMRKALSDLGGAIRVHPHVPSLRVWRGQLLLQKREFSTAFVDLEKAVHLDPHHALAHAWYGWGLTESGQPQAALAWLRRAVELEPAAWVFSGWLADAEFHAGARRQALARLAQVLKARPKTWWVLHQRAQFHMLAGRPKEALKDVSEALGYEGRHADAYYLMAQARLALSDVSGAFTAIERALVISPNMGRAYLLRAQIRTRQGRPDGVLSDYRTVYDRFPYLFNAEQKGQVEELLKR